VRLAFTVQRFGAEVAGGAETLCRQTAHALAERGDEVVVFTTTARDYLSWAPYYPAGVTHDGPVEVRRFSVEPPDPDRAGDLVRTLSVRPDPDLEVDWARAQGPVSKPLLAALAECAGGFDAVCLWTYLYATTQLSMPLVRDRAVLVPLAHDEPMLRFTLTRGLAAMARGFAFLTPEERDLVDDVLGVADRPAEVVGAGLHVAAPGDAERARRAFAVPPRFALYLGRVDGSKGVDAMVRAHAAYRADHPDALGLVLAGRPAGELRLPEWVVRTGFVDEATRSDLLAAAEVVVLPSPWESLSLVALEAWQAGRPTLATARSAVLAGQTARSGGGLLYTGPATYGSQLHRLAADAGLREQLGRAGRGFAEGETWDACAARWHGLLGRVRRPVEA
jgi:glycosyltransferase involved in cell wall biosynthesis